jgi:hypothetical protein
LLAEEPGPPCELLPGARISRSLCFSRAAFDPRIFSSFCWNSEDPETGGPWVGQPLGFCSGFFGSSPLLMQT